MNTETVTIKNSGATFTPTALADFLSDKILRYFDGFPEKCTILDPACGDGALLTSIAKKINNTFDFELRGYETNIEYLIEAKNNLSLYLSENQYEINHCDFLEVAMPRANDLFFTCSNHEFTDVVIANPPYVRTQILGAEKSQQIAKTYNLKGKIDLYYPFLIGMTNALKKGGIIGVITSNRYLTTKSGAEIRKFLIENYDILEVIDLGDSKLFDAAVLPAILIGRKKTSKRQLSTPCHFTKIYEEFQLSKNGNISKIHSVYDILKQENSALYTVDDGRVFNYSVGLLKHSHIKTDIWQMTNDDENKWIEQIQKNTAFYIGDKFKVRIGIKSCADNVFLNENWGKEFISSEKKLFRPLISRENIERWTCSTGEYSKVLYPHYSANGKRAVYDLSQFPKAEQYLNKHRKQLEARDYVIQAGRRWYEMWVPQNPELWKFPKLIFPDISVGALFSYDESGAIVNGNCYWIVAQIDNEKELLLLIQGVANSSLMAQYHDLCFNNKLYSGRRRYLSQYIEKYPIPDPSSVFSKRIIEIVKLLNDKCSLKKELEKELNDCVNKAFGFTD
ncbi:MAG: N-6 DNA methylase [Fibrobacter sp.]|jgi:type I restriction-modification system DNA methylase subunit|nr:N-6 DNA methylase [Fibrobacter sp.]